MARFAYVNGRYRPMPQAAVHIEDRGFQFADGVYEVCEVRGGRLVDESAHLARLTRSLVRLSIARPMTVHSLRVVVRQVMIQNGIENGLIYIQVTRGAAPRSHAFPVKPTRPSLIVTARAADQPTRNKNALGIAVITVPETRWASVDIKTIALLPNVLAKQAAFEAGAQEAWFVAQDGLVNEGASSNVWIVNGDGVLVTPPKTAQILEGVTRAVVLKLSQSRGVDIEERRFSVNEALAAREAFVTSATALVTPVIRLDGIAIGEGGPGPVAVGLRLALLDNPDLAPRLAQFVA
ncbi:MAG: D-amino-acid transaminase [Alphaproteobacteria bacterium]